MLLILAYCALITLILKNLFCPVKLYVATPEVETAASGLTKVSLPPASNAS